MHSSMRSYLRTTLPSPSRRTSLVESCETSISAALPTRLAFQDYIDEDGQSEARRRIRAAFLAVGRLEIKDEHSSE